MSKPNDGGSAFPRPYSHNPQQWSGVQGAVLEQEGMTRRQYYAGQAMLGLLAVGKRGHFVADLAVKHADDLISELEKELPE